MLSSVDIATADYFRGKATVFNDAAKVKGISIDKAVSLMKKEGWIQEEKRYHPPYVEIMFIHKDKINLYSALIFNRENELQEYLNLYLCDSYAQADAILQDALNYYSDCPVIKTSETSFGVLMDGRYVIMDASISVLEGHNDWIIIENTEYR